jgi:hypothetical protein
LKRLSDNVLKVAALMAIDSAEFGEVPRVALEHFEPARLLGLRWVNSTVKLVDAIGRTGFQRDCDGVLTTIRTSRDGMRIRDVYRKHRRLKNRDFNEVLTALQNQDEITIAEGESASGPAARIVRATRGGK